MSRRVSSRDDLFLSALDMYTLLSLVFIGVAFMASYSSEERRVLDLPIASGAGQPVTPTDRTETLQLRWAGPEDVLGRAGRTCQLAVVRSGPFPLTAGARVPVPCWPGAFGRDSAPSPVLTQALERFTAEHRGQEPAAIILCQREDLLACARLQWLVAEHGLRPVALLDAARSAR